jgi:ubiquinone/menaquinone biosynthesis C-methylase UbiE
MQESPVHPHAIAEYSHTFFKQCHDRASGVLPEMDSVRQAIDWLRPMLKPGMSVLDVGCAAGHAARSFRELGVNYYGVDSGRGAVEIGRVHLAEIGIPPGNLRIIPIEDLPGDETFDAVICLSTLLYMPMFHLPLEIMARAAKSWLVIRSSFSDKTQIRFLPDVLLEPGFQTVRSHFNVYSKHEIQNFLEAEGLDVTWAADRRQTEKYDGKPETVGGVTLPYDFLFATRVRPVPTDEEILGETFGEAARIWTHDRAGGPNP